MAGLLRVAICRPRHHDEEHQPTQRQRAGNIAHQCNQKASFASCLQSEFVA
jgi:hypothetical protein